MAKENFDLPVEDIGIKGRSTGNYVKNKLITYPHPELKQIEYYMYEKPGGYTSVQMCRIEVYDRLKKLKKSGLSGDTVFTLPYCLSKYNEQYNHRVSLNEAIELVKNTGRCPQCRCLIFDFSLV